MYFVNSYFTVAIYLTVIVGGACAVLHWLNVIAADSRMKRMMVSCGIAEETAENAGQLLKLDIDAVKARCRNCADIDLCERWLDGKPVENACFCPNIRHFSTAARSN